MKTILLAVMLALVPIQALAQAKPPITIAQALGMLVALRSLDGHSIVIKGPGGESTVQVPWEFRSGLLRLKIAKNIALLASVEKSTDDARMAIAKELLKAMPAGADGAPAATIQPGSPAMERFLAQFQEVLNQPAAGSEALMRIKASELRLDANEIPVSALSALEPILDVDVK